MRTSPAATSDPQSWTWRAFFIGIGSMLFLRAGGYLALAEIFFLFHFLRSLPSFYPRQSSAVPINFLLVWILWLIGTVLSDIINETPVEFVFKGFARCLFAGVTTLGVYSLLHKNHRELAPLLWGLSLSMLASLFVLSPGQLADTTRGEDMRFTFSHSLNYVILAFVSAFICSYYTRFPRLVTAGLFCSGMIYIYLGSRSVGACQLASAFSLISLRTTGVLGRGRAMTYAFSTKLLMIAIIGLTAAAVFYGYRQLAEQGLLSQDALEKHARNTKDQNELSSSRGVYFLAGFFAWLDRPLLGHGSSPRDTNAYLLRACAFLELSPTAYLEEYQRSTDDVPHLPVHSMLMSSGVEQGIFGLFFTLYILQLYLRCSVTIVRQMPQYAAYVILAFWLGVWSLLFSPPPQRMLGAIPAGLLLTASWNRGRISFPRRSSARHGRANPYVRTDPYVSRGTGVIRDVSLSRATII